MSEVSYHGWTHRPKADGGTDPIPAASPSSIQMFRYKSTTNMVDTGLTALQFTSEEQHGSNFVVSTSSFDISVKVAGVYQFDLYSRDWATDGSASTVAEYEAHVTSGSTGKWTSRGFISNVEAYSVQLLKVARDADGDPAVPNTPDTYLTHSPDLHAIGAWISTDTFPVIIRFKAATLDDTSAPGTYAYRNDSGPVFMLGVTRFGDAYE